MSDNVKIGLIKTPACFLTMHDLHINMSSRVEGWDELGENKRS